MIVHQTVAGFLRRSGLPEPGGRNEPCVCGSGTEQKACTRPDPPLARSLNRCRTALRRVLTARTCDYRAANVGHARRRVPAEHTHIAELAVTPSRPSR